MFERIPVFIPAEGAAWISLVDARSGIVGSPAPEWFDYDDDIGKHVIDFEGNRYGAANMVTYADRVHHAYGRHTEHYPTVARLVVSDESLEQVGWFYVAERRIEVEDGLALTHLCRWLELGHAEQFTQPVGLESVWIPDSDALAVELRPSHVIR